MIKKLMVAFVAGGLLSAPVMAADMDGMQGAGAQLGYVSPGGDLGDTAKAGMSIGAHYFRGLPNNFGLLVGLDNTSLSAKSGGADYTNLAVSANGVYLFPAENLPVMPFALLGLSYNMQSYEAGGASEDGNGIGFNLGVGANKQINDSWMAGVCLTYKTYPDFDLPAAWGGGSATGNAIVFGVHANYKFGS